MPVHLARRLSQVLLSVVAEAIPAEMARNEFGLLANLSLAPPFDQKRIAVMMAQDATTVGQLIDALEAKGFARRVPSLTDRRVKYVEVTDAGRRYVAEYRPKVLKAQHDALSALTETERKTLLDLMARVIEANPEHDRPGAGRRAPKPSSK